MTEDTVLGVAIEPRKPARELTRRDVHRAKIRLDLIRGPFLSAFDAGIDEVQV